MTERKIIQVSEVFGCLVAVCNDGTLLAAYGGKWHVQDYGPVPQPEESEEDASALAEAREALSEAKENGMTSIEDMYHETMRDISSVKKKAAKEVAEWRESKRNSLNSIYDARIRAVKTDEAK